MGDGFLGFPASTLMLDVVVCALILVVPVLVYSLFVVKVQRNYSLHRTLQLTLGVVLLGAVLLFEIDMQMHGGWEKIVNRPEGRLTEAAYSQVRMVLYIHLIFAISTPILWIATIVLALKRFGNPPQPGPHSRQHQLLGWLATIDLVLTSGTGLVFYYLAFVAA